MKTLLLIATLMTTAFAAPAPQNPDPRPDITEWANIATSEQLQEVDGIGPAIAARIIAARPFATASELVTKVSGIGPAKFRAIADHVAEIRD